jgi:RNA polymerase sigma factor (sigma-70 family)
MTDLVETYNDVCEELLLSHAQRRALWLAVADEVERVASYLPDAATATIDDIEGACRKLHVPTVRHLGLRVRDEHHKHDQHGVSNFTEFRHSEPSEVFLANLAVIEQIVFSTCRRNGIDRNEAEEMCAEVKLRLIDKDYAIIRNYSGRSHFATYIAAVVQRLLIDSKRHYGGKWHNSVEAQRLGEKGIAIERSLIRDGRSIDDALVHLRIQYPDLTREDIEMAAARFSSRVRRRMVDLGEASDVVAPGAADESVLWETAQRISSVVSAYIDNLSVEDQLIFRLRFDSDMTVAQIAGSLHLDQQLLYQRLYKHFSNLRETLVRAGLDTLAVEKVIGSNSPLLDFRLKKRGVRSSEEGESAVADTNGEPSS